MHTVIENTVKSEPKQFRIKFCWAQEFPLTIVLDNQEKIVPETNNRTIAIFGSLEDDIPDLLQRLKGTDPRVISNINSISICQF